MRNGHPRSLRLHRIDRPALAQSALAPLGPLVPLALAVAGVFVLLGATPPGMPGAATVGSYAEGGQSEGAGPTSSLLATLAPFLLIALVVVTVIAVAAAVILFRTRGTETPATSDGWWTCPKCGAGNVDGAARCHACGTWRTTAARPTPSASP